MAPNGSSSWRAHVEAELARTPAQRPAATSEVIRAFRAEQLSHCIVGGYVQPSHGPSRTDGIDFTFPKSSISERTAAAFKYEQKTDAVDESVQHDARQAEHAEDSSSDDQSVATSEEWDHVPRHRLSAGDVVISDNILRIHEYLGDHWTQKIVDFHNVPSLAQSITSINLFPYQEQGIAKILHMFDGDFRGGIMGDMMGLGKTIMTLVAVMIDRRKRPGTFSLVITSKSCVSQWRREAHDYFRPEHRPRCLVLDDPKTTFADLQRLRPDIVIVSRGFLIAQYRRLVERQRLLNKTRMAATTKGKAMIAPILCLYTEMYSFLDLPFPHVIVDDAHHGKEEDGLMHQAVKELFRRNTLLISGTFIANRWSDIFTFVDLIGGHAFGDKEQFSRCFGDDSLVEPQPVKFPRMVKFLQRLVLSRPNSVLDLKGHHIYEQLFTLNAMESKHSNYWLLKWLRALSLIPEDERGNHHEYEHVGIGEEEREDERSKDDDAMLLTTRAAVCSNHLATAPLVDVATIDGILGNFETMFRRYEDGQESGRSLDKAQYAPALTSFDQRTRDRTAYAISHVLQSRKYGNELFSASEGGNARTLDQRCNDGNAQRFQRAMLKGMLPTMPNEQLFSSRTAAIVQFVMDCRQKHAGEKIVLFSKYAKFLDMLDEALQRRLGRAINIIRFDGELSVTERTMARHMFEVSASPQTIILVTSGAGGTGINLSAASVVIQAEPWWNRNEELQAWFRTICIGQQRTVNIYCFLAVNAMIDLYTVMRRNEKARVIARFMQDLTREDDAELVVPTIIKHL